MFAPVLICVPNNLLLLIGKISTLLSCFLTLFFKFLQVPISYVLNNSHYIDTFPAPPSCTNFLTFQTLPLLTILVHKNFLFPRVSYLLLVVVYLFLILDECITKKINCDS